MMVYTTLACLKLVPERVRGKIKYTDEANYIFYVQTEQILKPKEELTKNHNKG